MSDVITFNTETGDYGQVQKHKDPWHHLGAADWVQKQVDWANQSEPAGAGLVEPISKLKGELVGVEIGVCLGATTETFLKQVPNITATASNTVVLPLPFSPVNTVKRG